MSDESVHLGSRKLRGVSAEQRDLPPVADTVSVITPPVLADLGGRGTEVGRFILLEPLGAGGMGMVYAAYDPELDRRVAIKLLLPCAEDGSSTQRTRLLREAQALARLAHPNVVAVHDVGIHGESVWIAMELVHGQTLDTWSRQQSRRWPEILRVLTDVGCGVAAAHAVGLVHRDLKPSNVMIDRDRRVRVMDFGLAHGRVPRVDGSDIVRSDSLGSEARLAFSALTIQMTRSGAIQGTPAYMAPEQLRGQDVTTAADQFGWSVMAWELLYGERPFSDVMTVLHGQRRPPAKGRHVPTWLRRIVERGLSTDPVRRWPTMTALLMALERGRTRAQVKAGALVFLGAAAIGASVLGSSRWAETRQVAACEAEGASIVADWNEEVKAKLRQGLLATGVPYAEMTADKAIPYFERQVEAWKAARTAACMDTRVWKQWSEDLLDRSTWCLDERRMELTTLVDELSHSDSTSVQLSVAAAAAGLLKVHLCRDPQRLSRLPPLPTERDGIAATLQQLSKAGARGMAGKFKEGLDEAQMALLAAQEIGWQPLIASARLRVGDLLGKTGALREAESALEEAYFQAVAVGALDVATDAAMNLMSTVGYAQGRHEEGVRWSRHTAVMLSALGEGENGLRRSTFLNELANVYMAEKDYASARPLLERSLAIFERDLGSAHPAVAASLNGLAAVHSKMGAFNEAKSLLERAHDTLEKALGANHPDVAISLNNLAGVHDAMGERDEAKALYQQALESFENSLGSEHLLVAQTLNNIARIDYDRGKFEDGLMIYRRAMPILAKALGPEHPTVGRSINNIAFGLYSLGEYREAAPMFEQAAAIFAKSQGYDHVNVATCHENLASVHYNMGAYKESRMLFERILPIYEKGLGSEHLKVASALNGLARVALAQRRPLEAKVLAERALRIRETSNAPAQVLAFSRFVLAQAIWSAPGSRRHDRERALLLAQQARAGYRESGAKDKVLKEIESFLNGKDIPEHTSFRQ